MRAWFGSYQPASQPANRLVRSLRCALTLREQYPLINPLANYLVLGHTHAQPKNTRERIRRRSQEHRWRGKRGTDLFSLFTRWMADPRGGN